MIIQSLEKLHDVNRSVRERGILEIIAISTQVPSKSRKGMSQEEKEELVKKLFNGLVSKKIAIRETFFVVLTNFLRANKTFEEEWLLETLDSLISTLSKGPTNAKAKDVKNLKVMGYGSLIRSDSINKLENYLIAFEKLYKTSKSLTSNMPSNFTCLLLSKFDKRMFKQSLLQMKNEVVYVKEKSNGLVCVSIEMMAKKHGLKAPTDILDNVELLVEILSKEYKGGDNPLIEEIFNDLSERKLISSFWKLVDEKYLYFDLQALKVIQSIALSYKKCPRDLLIQYTLTLLNSSIGEYRELGKVLSYKTLVWDDSFAKNEKKRAKVIKLFFGPESLLEHYKVIPQQYKKFLKDIIQNVEGIAQEIIQKCQENIENGVLQLSSLNVLYWMIVDQSLEIGQDHKMSILKSNFILPFLKNSIVEDEKNKENEETKKNISTVEFLRNIFSLSGDFNILLEGFDIVANDSNFLKTFPDETLLIWKNGLQLFDKLSGEFLLLIKLSLMRLLVTSNIQAANIDTSYIDSKGKDEIMIIEKIIHETAKCHSKKSEDKSTSLIRIVMNCVLQLEAPFFNTELFFKKLDSENKINCEHIKILADGILEEYESNEGISLKQHDMEDEEMQTDDDQSSIDLDQASEESLMKLDKILAACVRKTENVSNPKYLRIKKILQIIENCILRSRNCNLIPSFLSQVINHYTNDGTAVLEAKACYKFLCKVRKLKKNPKCTINVSKTTIENLIKEIQLIKDELEEEENDDSDEDEDEGVENMEVDENDDDDDDDDDQVKESINDNDDSDKEEDENEDERIVIITQILKMLSKCFDI